MSKDENTWEIIVFPKGTSHGDRFVNKSKTLADEIIDSVVKKQAFQLKFHDGAIVAYAPGEVYRVRVTDTGRRVGL